MVLCKHQRLIASFLATQVVNIDVPHDVILDRIANRMVHAQSGRVYNMTWNPPKVAGLDDITGEPLTRRADDCPVSLTPPWTLETNISNTRNRKHSANASKLTPQKLCPC